MGWNSVPALHILRQYLHPFWKHCARQGQSSWSQSQKPRRKQSKWPSDRCTLRTNPVRSR